MNDRALCEKIAECVTKGLLYEVSASIKPGLVDRFNCGSHKDMDFFTFIDSACAISKYFEKFAMSGIRWSHINENSLSTIRKLGIDCDNAMFEATNGVNVHKGAVFSMSIISACSAFTYKKYGKMDLNKICEYASIVAKPALADFEISKTKETNLTNGEKLYINHGILGVRGEVASGFKSVMEYAMPVIKDLDKLNVSKDEVLLNTLLNLIANVDDTNIISRKGFDALVTAKNMAQNCISLGGASTDSGKKYLLKMNEDFVEMNISPGGCADLLAVASTFYFLTKI